MTRPGLRSAWFTLVLPCAVIAPDVVNLGLGFVRLDYVLLLALAPAVFSNKALRVPSTQPLGFAAYWVAAGLAAFIVYQLCAVPWGAGDVSPYIKYALAPLKAIAWALYVRRLYVVFGFGPSDVYRMVVTMTVVVFAIQCAELAIPQFRAALFTAYPVASESRLQELTFRARGPFSGYDAASVFFAVALVITVELGALSRPSRWRRVAVPTLCLAGAFLAARTGFGIAVMYLLVRLGWAAGLGPRIAAGLVAAALLSLVALAPEGDDSSLTGRYAEVLRAIHSGDLTEISSVQGTIDMNEQLFHSRSNLDLLWGAGLQHDTTADQLYARYMYMLGLVGFALWIAIQGSILAASIGRLRRRRLPVRHPYAAVAFGVAVLYSVAHWKGGNYYFASRLGDIALFVTFLGISAVPRDRPRPSRERPVLTGAPCNVS